MSTSFWILWLIYLIGIIVGAPAIAKELAKAGVGTVLALVAITLWPVVVLGGLAASSYGKK